MRKVFLHGRLGELFGEEWDLDVSSVNEAVRAIKANTVGFFEYLTEKGEDGIRYRVIIGGEDHDCDEDLIINHSEEKDFHIVPVPESYKAGVRIIVGIVLVVVGFYDPTGTLTSMGISLIVGGIAELIMGNTDPLTSIEDQDTKAGFNFNSQVNTVRQGGPIPLLYGEIIHGSQLINFYQVTPSNSNFDYIGSSGFPFYVPIYGNGARVTQ